MKERLDLNLARQRVEQFQCWICGRQLVWSDELEAVCSGCQHLSTACSCEVQS